MDPLSLFGRKDKWSLGGGKGAIYAPTHPRWLLEPGFWDECFFADIRLERLFAVFFLKNGKPLRLSSYLKGWRPDRLTIMHVSGKVVIREIRCVTENNVWVSQFELVTDVGPLDMLVWTVQETHAAGSGLPHKSNEEFTFSNSAVQWKHIESWPNMVPQNRSGIPFSEENHLLSERINMGHLSVAIGANAKLLGSCLLSSERCDTSPKHENCPLSEMFSKGELRNISQKERPGMTHVLLHYKLNDRENIQVSCAVSVDKDECLHELDRTNHTDAIADSAKSWIQYFASVPQFECSDPYFTNAYWHRWFGLRLNTVDVKLPNYPNPCVFEGIGVFRNLISYSAPAHILETSWMHDPALALGEILSFVSNQNEDGSFPGHTYSIRPKRDFYHADWGSAIKALSGRHKIAEEDQQRISKSLQKYSEYLINFRSKNKLGGIEVWDQNETGQEYSPRYDGLTPEEDPWKQFRIIGVDATTYGFALKSFLGEDTSTLRAAIEALFDEKSGQFYDADVNSGETQMKSSAVNFYPHMLSDICTPKIAKAMTKSILIEDGYWTRYPFATTSKDDPEFSESGIWKGIRMNCPWNGRVWPMVNSHIVESLMTASKHEPELKKLAAELMTKWVRMMTFDDDPKRPNCFEHYNPMTGEPSTYRGVDDYMHSWLNDLIIRFVCGIESEPIDCGLEWFSITDVPTISGKIDREWKRG